MKNILFVLAFFFTIILTSQVIGKIETLKGKEILVYSYQNYYGIIEGTKIGSQFLYYRDKDGVICKIAQKKIKKFTSGSKIFIGLKTIGSLMRLQEIIAVSDKYMLTTYHDNYRELFYIYNKIDMSVVEKRIEHSEKKKKDLVSIKLIHKYFQCDELFDLINSRIIKIYGDKKKNKSGSTIFIAISNYNCDK